MLNWIKWLHWGVRLRIDSPVVSVSEDTMFWENLTLVILNMYFSVLCSMGKINTVVWYSSPVQSFSYLLLHFKFCASALHFEGKQCLNSYVTFNAVSLYLCFEISLMKLCYQNVTYIRAGLNLKAWGWWLPVKLYIYFVSAMKLNLWRLINLTQDLHHELWPITSSAKTKMNRSKCGYDNQMQ